MIEVHMFIPIRDNEGRKFARRHDEFDQTRLAGLFGGFSVQSGLVTGGWLHNGKLYSDQSRVMTVALESITEGHKVGKAVAFAKRHYRQERIYISYLGVSEIL